MENGQVLHSSLYVEQIDKFAVSLKQLAKTFLKLEEKKQTFSEEEIDIMLPNSIRRCNRQMVD